MSHYSTVRTEIRDKDKLIQALVDMGFKREHIEVHDEAQHLYGYQGERRDEKANIIVRRRNVGAGSNDLGFVLRPDGTYEAIISDFDRRDGKSRRNKLTTYMKGFSQDWLEMLHQRYRFNIVKEKAVKEGWELEERWEGNQLEARLIRWE